MCSHSCTSSPDPIIVDHFSKKEDSKGSHSKAQRDAELAGKSGVWGDCSLSSVRGHGRLSVQSSAAWADDERNDGRLGQGGCGQCT